MAAADLTRTGINNQKRSVSVLVAPLAEADILVDGSIYANLPARSLITAVIVNVTTVSTTATSTIDVLVGTDVVANEVAVTTAGAIVGTVVSAQAYRSTGGELIVKAGAVTPAAGDFVGEVIVEYVELDKTNGEYTA